MSFRHTTSGHWINLTPDELFAACNDLTPLLPAKVSLWGLNLVPQFFDALSFDLQEALHTDPLYASPDLSTLTSRSSQLAALRLFRAAAVRNHTILRNHERLIAKTVLRKLKHNPAAALAAPLSGASVPPTPAPASSVPLGQSDDVSGLTRTVTSPAEQTMHCHQQPTSTDGPTEFPTMDPLTHFQSPPYPVGFPGCMFCGATEHVFRSCPQHSIPGASAIFFKNLFAHKPHLRKRDPLPGDYLPAPPPSGIPATQSFPPPVHPPPPSSVTLPPPILKKAKFMLMLAKSFSAHASEPRVMPPPMPVAIGNGLPHIYFDLGTDASVDPSLVGLMDTCGALTERPDLVSEFISFDDENPFKPIKLGGAISEPSDFDSSTHGNLTAVIRHCTPYVDPLGTPVAVSFALGSNVTVNTIFGLPVLCDLDAIISLRSNSLHSRALNLDFPIARSAANFGLSAGCSFDPASAAFRLRDSRQHSLFGARSATLSMIAMQTPLKNAMRPVLCCKFAANLIYEQDDRLRNDFDLFVDLIKNSLSRPKVHKEEGEHISGLHQGNGHGRSGRGQGGRGQGHGRGCLDSGRGG